ncbi:MAG: PAS domain-containing sensor histidine kinase, partial [Cytophagales bacterium CG18_big_fil_WC_8_21_14_2_50_42_9]
MKACYNNRALQQVVKYSLDMICTIDHEGRFAHVSDACKPILGYESEELLGQFYLDFVHPLDYTRTLKIIRGLIKGNKTTSFENNYIGKNGKAISIVWSAVWSETERMMICVGRDATEQKLTRQELREKE